MQKHHILTSVCFLIVSSISAFAAHYSVDEAASELAATMHASPSHDFTSVAKDYTCDIEIEPETLSVLRAKCSFTFAGLDSGKESRDNKMRKWMDIKKFPAAQFEMTEQLPDNAAGEHVAKGNFTMHGEIHPITINYTLEREDGQLVLEGHCTLDHQDWGLDKVRLLFFSVDPVVKPHFRLVGQLEEAQIDV